MNTGTKIIIALLAALVVLLFANLMATYGKPISLASPAMADIVSGKNYFTTHSPDGRSVYLWYYDYQGTAFDKDATVTYLGQVEVGGKYIRP